MKWAISLIRRFTARAETPFSMRHLSKPCGERHRSRPLREACRTISFGNIRTRIRLRHARLARAGLQKLVSDRVGQRLKRGVDDIGGDANRRPAFTRPIAKLDQHTRHRVGSTLENPDPEIDEFEVFDKTLIFAEILAQGEVERIDRTLAFGGGDQGFAVDAYFDDRLRHRDEIALCIVAALDIDAKA